jgi:hypothetical protein
MNGEDVPDETVIGLPPGFSLNFPAVDICPKATFEKMFNLATEEEGCPPSSQIGIISTFFGGEVANRSHPVYRLETEPNDFATLGFPHVLNRRAAIIAHVDLRTDSDYGITLTLREGNQLSTFVPAAFVTLWGVPADPRHDAERWQPEGFHWGATVDLPPDPLVTGSSNCAGDAAEAHFRLLYQFPEEHWLPEDLEDPSYRFVMPEPEGCEDLTFDPRADLALSTDETDSASGIAGQLEVPQPEDASPGGPPVKKMELRMPRGLELNPAAATGLAGCTVGEIGLEALEGPPGTMRFNRDAASCPAGSRIGTATVESPVADKPIEGDVYLAMPYDNPFRSLLALYVVFSNSSSGDGGPNVILKFAAEITVDSSTGQLAVRTNELPQLPIDRLTLALPGKEGGPLVTPLTCSEDNATVDLMAWSGQQASLNKGLAVTQNTAGLPCQPHGESLPFSPAVHTDLSANVAAGYSPVSVGLRRAQGDQELKAFKIKLPRGLVANLRGVGRCSEQDIHHAEERGLVGEGINEQTDPSCPRESLIGSTEADVGTGSTPLQVKGPLYLGGPWNGSPFSVIAVVPALGGGSAIHPLIDLGVVVRRFGVSVDPTSGQLVLTSDVLPSKLFGIPLRITDIRLLLDRPNFMRTPSDCGPLATEADVIGGNGAQARTASPFQVEGCDSLSFSPRLGVKFTRGMTIDRHPRLRTILKMSDSEAAVSSARLVLPQRIGLNHSRLSKICSPDVWAVVDCPGRIKVGRAVASVPVLGQRLAGEIYVRRSRLGSFELALELNSGIGLEGVTVEIRGKLSVRGDGRIQATFTHLPDLPLDWFKVVIDGVRDGLFVNVHGLCGARLYGEARLMSYGGQSERRRIGYARNCDRSRIARVRATD